MTAFLYGLGPSLENSAVLDSATAFELVGGNTGNLAFCHAIDRQLGGGLPVVPWSAAPATVDASGATGVLTLANQLGPHVNLGGLAKTIAALRCGLVGVGLGAQGNIARDEIEIPAGTLDWVRAIRDHAPSAAPNLAMRGEFSRRALEKYRLADRAVVTGCPTLFISPDRNLGKAIAARFTGSPRRIAVAAGHQRWEHLARIEASLVQMASPHEGSYICQSALEMVRLGRGEIRALPQEVRNACRTYACPQLSDAEFIDWCDRRAQTFFSASAWMEHLRRYDFVIGTRIHGVMLALQAGVPAMCVVHDSRTAELCETMLVPHVAASAVSAGIRRDDLQRLFVFDPDAFDSNRRMLAARYTDFLGRNGLRPAPFLRALGASDEIRTDPGEAVSVSASASAGASAAAPPPAPAADPVAANLQTSGAPDMASATR